MTTHHDQGGLPERHPADEEDYELGSEQDPKGSDPVFHQKGEEYDGIHTFKEGWYFWDETWANKHGPYKTEEDARDALKKYAEQM